MKSLSLAWLAFCACAHGQIIISATPVGPFTPINPQPTLVKVVMNGTQDGGSFGQAVSRIGDLNGNGRADVLIGAPYETGLIANQTPGRAYVRNSRNGADIPLPFPLNMFGTNNGDEFGRAVAGLPDIDGDGMDDMIIGAPGNAPGYARVISGGTGLMINLPPPLPAAVPTIQVGGFGYAVADAGDVNGDGVGDYVVGAPFTMVSGVQHGGLVQVYNGATGANMVFASSFGAIPGITTTQFLAYLGISVGSAGDWNGDGFDDVIAGAYNPNGVGFANIYSGRWISSQQGPQILAVLQGNFVTDGFGISVKAAGDVNQDGLGDVIVGSYFGNFAEVFTGRTTFVSNPAPLYQFTSTGSTGFGYAVSGGLDATGDGVPDLLVGPSNPSGPNYRAVLFSGATGAQVASYSGSASSFFAVSLDLAYDITGNNRAEVLVGAAYATVGAIQPGQACLFIR